MKDERLRRLLGNVRRDLGCDAGFAVMDQYAEALQRGEDVEGLLTALRER
jgi:hypothetical protein